MFQLHCTPPRLDCPHGALGSPRMGGPSSGKASTVKRKGISRHLSSPPLALIGPLRAGRTYGPAGGKSSREPCQGGPDGAGGRHKSAGRAGTINNTPGRSGGSAGPFHQPGSVLEVPLPCLWPGAASRAAWHSSSLQPAGRGQLKGMADHVTCQGHSRSHHFVPALLLFCAWE